MPGPYFNWRALADIDAKLAWFMVINRRRTGRVDPRFLELHALLLDEEPAPVFPAKLLAKLQRASYVMSLKFSEQPHEREMHAEFERGDEATASVVRDQARITWMDGVYAVGIPHADVRYYSTTDHPSPALPANDPRPRVVYAKPPEDLVHAMTNVAVRAGERVTFDGQSWVVAQFMVRTRGGIQTDPFAHLDAPFDPEFMHLDSLALIPERYVLVA